MCRCNPENPEPYCSDCNTIIPRRSVRDKQNSLYSTIVNCYFDGDNEKECLNKCRGMGYLVSEGEIEIAYYMVQCREGKELGEGM